MHGEGAFICWYLRERKSNTFDKTEAGEMRRAKFKARMGI